MLSMKNLMFKERLAKKLVDQHIGLYIIDEIVFTNAIKLQLLTSMRISSGSKHQLNSTI